MYKSHQQRSDPMTLIENYGNGIEIWLIAGEYLVYGARVGGDAVACPSEGMAREVAASALD